MSKKLVDKPEDWSSIVGMPDASDKRNIQTLVEIFNKTVFNLPSSDEPDAPMMRVTGAQWTKAMVDDARKQHGLDDPTSSDYGEKSKQMEMRIICAIPQPLHMKLLEGYPTMFRDHKQHMWFAKNFREFVVPRKL